MAETFHCFSPVLSSVFQLPRGKAPRHVSHRLFSSDSAYSLHQTDSLPYKQPLLLFLSLFSVSSSFSLCPPLFQPVPHSLRLAFHTHTISITLFSPSIYISPISFPLPHPSLHSSDKQCVYHPWGASLLPPSAGSHYRMQIEIDLPDSTAARAAAQL